MQVKTAVVQKKKHWILKHLQLCPIVSSKSEDKRGSVFTNCATNYYPIHILGLSTNHSFAMLCIPLVSGMLCIPLAPGVIRTEMNKNELMPSADVWCKSVGVCVCVIEYQGIRTTPPAPPHAHMHTHTHAHMHTCTHTLIHSGNGC
jgi:hypothetical protein